MAKARVKAKAKAKAKAKDLLMATMAKEWDKYKVRAKVE
jgi:hypothetical protein